MLVDVSDLYSNEFTGEIPTNIATIPTLKYVYFSKNQFTGTIPNGWVSTDMVEL